MPAAASDVGDAGLLDTTDKLLNSWVSYVVSRGSWGDAVEWNMNPRILKSIPDHLIRVMITEEVNGALRVYYELDEDARRRFNVVKFTAWRLLVVIKADYAGLQGVLSGTCQLALALADAVEQARQCPSPTPEQA